MKAALDNSGLVFHRNFYGVFLKDNAKKISLPFLTAVLNGPVANAYIFTHSSTKWSNSKDIESIPMPSQMDMEDMEIEYIEALVKKYVELAQNTSESEECHKILLEIDAFILEKYSLPPKLEKQLLDFFRGQERPTYCEFREYYPADFTAAFPLHEMISENFGRIKTKEILKMMPDYSEPAIINFFKHIARK